MSNKRSLNLILSEIGSAMDALADLGREKSEVLVERNVAGLEKLIPSEQDLVTRLEALEIERRAAATETGPEIERLRESLKQKAKRIAETNERNRGLLRRGLDIVQYELKLFFQEGKPLVFDHRV
jgi:flagellar biosynthesis/type III secretory pathway chaperone